ncbi:hypothetical protein Mapa_006380 [Marchantia paleacea]|nr:hypothetical protein Mapa_006380 [Marchantia paleacea]
MHARVVRMSERDKHIDERTWRQTLGHRVLVAAMEIWLHILQACGDSSFYSSPHLILAKNFLGTAAVVEGVSGFELFREHIAQKA